MDINKTRSVEEVIFYCGSFVYPNKPYELRFSANEIEMLNEGRKESTNIMIGEYYSSISYNTIQFCIKKKKGEDSENVDSLNKIKELYDNRTASDITFIKIVFTDGGYEVIDTTKKTVYYLPLEDDNGALFNSPKIEDVYFRGVFDSKGRGLLI